MTLEELQLMWKEDTEINTSDIIGETIKIPKLHNKYYHMYVKQGLKVKKLKTDLVELEKVKSEYYNGSLDELELKKRNWAPFKLKVLRQDLPRYIDSDREIIELCLRIDYHASLTNYLEDIIKQINNRNFLIKNIIDWSKFQQGM